MISKFKSRYFVANIGFSPGLSLLAWLNIAIQITFPLAVAFTPVIAGAELQSQTVSSIETQTYTLGAGETARSVAKKYNLTLEELRQLNQFRTFARGLNNVQPGDELEVPAVAVKGGAKPGAFASQRAMVSGNDANDAALKMAGYSSQVGRFFANGSNSEAATSMARGMATSAAGGEVQRWLNQFGTARVQLDTDKNFSLKNSQFELLVPLYDRGDKMVFTQGSVHRTDDRLQANLGAGLRYFAPGYMLGANVFGDYDLSREHARMGVGAEYWRDFMKLSANGYMRLTGWKDSRDLADYQERPANGWDVRAQAWLPSLPQLGGKLTFEQYYGQEVALFGVNHRQRDPHAITAGITYTPVPLVTLGAEQRQGTSGKSDTRFSLNVNYQLGVPWQKQLNPEAVAAMRSLQGSRYDFVERNNNIVLEYRKKEIIRLHLAERVTGNGGEQKSLGVSVKSTHGLSHIEWDASTLTAAGGKIVQNGADYMVVLPRYQYSAQAVNTYTVSGVAVDTKGNRSDRQETQVTVLASAVNNKTSTFTPANSSLAADGVSEQVLTLTLKDDTNQLVDLDPRDIVLNHNTLKSATVSALTRKQAGVYLVTVKAGKDTETVTLEPTAKGISLPSATVAFNATLLDAQQSLFTVNPNTIKADNTEVSTFTLAAKDLQGKVMSGIQGNLSLLVKDSNGNTPSATQVTLTSLTESATPGTYTARLSGTKAGVYTIIPAYDNTSLSSLRATVTLTPGSPNPIRSAIATDMTRYMSSMTIRVTVALQDSYQNVITGATGLLTAQNVQVPNASLNGNWSDNQDGTYTATYTAGAVSSGNKATLQLSGWSQAIESAGYAINPIPFLQNISVNGATFQKGDGFPTTGFTGATFTLNIGNGAPLDFNWSSDATWVDVDINAVVSFKGTGDGRKVTITGTPKSGIGPDITYSFTLRNWFITDRQQVLWVDAGPYCSAQGYSQSTAAQVSQNSGFVPTGVRTLGALWNEWGSLGGTSAFPDDAYWLADATPSDPNYHYSLDKWGGNLYEGSGGTLSPTMCTKAL